MSNKATHSRTTDGPHSLSLASRSSNVHQPALRGLPLGRWALRTAAALALTFILLPLVFVVWLAFFAQEIPSFPPEGYTLKWFARIADNASFVKGFWLSLQVGVLATMIGIVLAVPASLMLARRRLPLHGALNQLLLLPLIVFAASGIQPPPALRPVPLPTMTWRDPTSMPLDQYWLSAGMLTSTVYGSSDVAT